MVSVGGATNDVHPDDVIAEGADETIATVDDDERAAVAEDERAAATDAEEGRGTDEIEEDPDLGPERNSAMKKLELDEQQIRRSARVARRRGDRTGDGGETNEGRQVESGDQEEDPDPPTPTLKLRNRWHVKTDSGIYPLADIMRKRLPRMLLTSPVIRADVFPTLELGGNTSSAVENCWRAMKHFGPEMVNRPLHKFLRPFIDWFVNNEYAFDTDTARIQGREVVAIHADRKDRIRALCAKEETKAMAQLDDIRRRKAALDNPGVKNSVTAAEGVAAAHGAHGCSALTEMDPKSDAPDFSNAGKEGAAEGADKSTWASSRGASASAAPRGKQPDTDEGDVQVRFPSLSYTKKECLICRARGEFEEDKVPKSTNDCANAMCAKHCKRFCSEQKTPEGGDGTAAMWKYESIVNLSDCKVCPAKSHVMTAGEVPPGSPTPK